MLTAEIGPVINEITVDNGTRHGEPMTTSPGISLGAAFRSGACGFHRIAAKEGNGPIV